MPAQHVINLDLAKVFETAKPKSVVTILAWGDLVEVTGAAAGGRIPVRAFRYKDGEGHPIDPVEVDAFLKIPKGKTEADVVIPLSQSKVLKVNFVDVQQGDGCVIETP